MERESGRVVERERGGYEREKRENMVLEVTDQEFVQPLEVVEPQDPILTEGFRV